MSATAERPKPKKIAEYDVRHAGIHDLDWLMQECREFAKHSETKLDLFGNEGVARASMATLIKDHLVLIAEKAEVADDGEGMQFTPVGFICGLLTPHFFNPEIVVLAELLWWVTPKYRGSRAGSMLLDQYAAWGKKNADWVTMCVQQATPLNEKSILKRGFRLYERAYLMEPQG